MYVGRYVYIYVCIGLSAGCKYIVYFFAPCKPRLEGFGRAVVLCSGIWGGYVGFWDLVYSICFLGVISTKQTGNGCR